MSVFKYTCIILTLVWIIGGNVNLHINTKHNTKYLFKGDVHVECAECQRGVRSIAGLAKPES